MSPRHDRPTEGARVSCGTGEPCEPVPRDTREPDTPCRPPTPQARARRRGRATGGGREPVAERSAMISEGGRERWQLRAKKTRAELETRINTGRKAGWRRRARARTDEEAADHGTEWSVGASRRSQGDGGRLAEGGSVLGHVPKARPHDGGSEGVLWDMRAPRACPARHPRARQAMPSPHPAGEGTATGASDLVRACTRAPESKLW